MAENSFAAPNLEHTVLATGQTRCHDALGREIPCPGTGQDGEHRTGRPWPEPRFRVIDGHLVQDRLTGLIWPQNASLCEFPLTWEEALAFVRDMNRENALGRKDWRLPNRREMRGLVDPSVRQPALPPGHPFLKSASVWHWTSTTSAMSPAYAWHVHLEGGRMFYGDKSQYAMFLPVCGENQSLLATGQKQCFDRTGEPVPCIGTGQDGELRTGLVWPEPRFALLDNGTLNDGVLDRATGLVWALEPLAGARGAPWQEALDLVKTLPVSLGKTPWRLPSINELESLVDASRHSPALPLGHPFTRTEEVYWSSTTSGFEADWAFALYLHKGAVGVGYKPEAMFHAWPVRAYS